MIFSTLQIGGFMLQNFIKDLEFDIDEGGYHGASYSKFKINFANLIGYHLI